MGMKASGAPPVALVAAAFALLMVATLAAFAVARELRSRDDVVNTVYVDNRMTRGGEARISFRLAEEDRSVAVEIRGGEGERVRQLPGGGALPAGRQVFFWDGRDDAGLPASAGRYGIRVILGEADRVIEPPGTIRLREEPPRGIPDAD
jgi:flagellar hook assembly protein FlgD